MVGPNSARDAKVSGAIDRAFGELFTFEAFKPGDDVNGRKTPDTSRTSFSAVAIWEGPSKSDKIVARGAVADDVAHKWSASHPSVSIDNARLIWTPRPGDKVTRQADGLFYEVSHTHPDGRARVLLQLTAKKHWVVVTAARTLQFNVRENSQFIPLI